MKVPQRHFERSWFRANGKKGEESGQHEAYQGNDVKTIAVANDISGCSNQTQGCKRAFAPRWSGRIYVAQRLLNHSVEVPNAKGELLRSVARWLRGRLCGEQPA